METIGDVDQCCGYAALCTDVLAIAMISNSFPVLGNSCSKDHCSAMRPTNHDP